MKIKRNLTRFKRIVPFMSVRTKHIFRKQKRILKRNFCNLYKRKNIEFD
jgi:hypothetical protein